jgi:hypothetical protein
MFAAQRDGLERLRQTQSALEGSSVGEAFGAANYLLQDDIMSLIGQRAGGGWNSPIGVGSANDGDDSHAVVGIIDPVDHPIGATTGAVSIIERWTEAFTDPLRVVEQRPNDELVCSKRDRLRQVLRELPPNRG